MAEGAIQLYRPTDPLAERSTFDVMPLAFQLAEKLAQTEFVPVALRMKPAAVAACILYGHEVGMPPMASLQHINVIQGKPGLSAAGQRALVLANGHRIWIEETTNTRAVICSQRRGEERILTTTWTMDDAGRAKLADKETWKAYPRNMLVARATGDNVRGNFMDVLVGLPYNAEELQDMADPDAPLLGEGTPEAGPSGTVRRKARRAATSPAGLSASPSEPPPAPEPSGEVADSSPRVAEPPPAPDPDATPKSAAAAPAAMGDVQTLTLAQQVAIVCREAGIDRARLIEAVSGKKQARDLTRPEATDVLEQARAIQRGEMGLVEVDGKWILEPIQRPLIDETQ